MRALSSTTIAAQRLLLRDRILRSIIVHCRIGGAPRTALHRAAAVEPLPVRMQRRYAAACVAWRARRLRAGGARRTSGPLAPPPPRRVDVGVGVGASVCVCEGGGEPPPGNACAASRCCRRRGCVTCWHWLAPGRQLRQVAAPMPPLDRDSVLGRAAALLGSAHRVED